MNHLFREAKSIDIQYVVLVSGLLFLPLLYLKDFFFQENIFLSSHWDTLLSATAVFVFLTKDLLRGQSYGKWKKGLQVIQSENLQTVAAPWQCVFRNATVIIFPVEIIAAWFRHDARRLGDLLAGTVVAGYDKNRSAAAWNFASNGIAVLLAVSLTVLAATPFYLLNRFFESDLQYFENELDKSKSQQITAAILKEIPEIKSADARVYNRSPRGEKDLILITINVAQRQSTRKSNEIGTTLRTICDTILGDSLYRSQCLISYNEANRQEQVSFSVR